MGDTYKTTAPKPEITSSLKRDGRGDGASSSPIKMSVRSETLGVREVVIEPFVFSEWKNDKKKIMELEKKAFRGENSELEPLRCSKETIRDILSEDSLIAVVARNDKNGEIIGMTYGVAWRYIEREDDIPKAMGGEMEAFAELPREAENAMGRKIPEETLYIYSIAVHPDFQRQQIGKNMVKMLVSEAEEKKVSVIVCHALVKTGSASVFRSALGIEGIKDYPDWYTTGVTARLFVKDLKQVEKSLRRE